MTADIVSLTHYDVVLDPEFEHDAILTRATCALRNDGCEPVAELDFDVLAAEQAYGVLMEMSSVSQRVGQDDLAQPFMHRSSLEPDARDAPGTLSHPKITRVTLHPPLRPGAQADLVFEYRWTTLNPADDEPNYRLLAALPNGDREVCLLCDYAWLPRPVGDYGALRDMLGRNWSPKCRKPTWRMSITVAQGYEAVALDGRLVELRHEQGRTVARWRSRTPGTPQVMIGRFDRLSVERPAATVVFYLPKGSYDVEAVDEVGGFLADAYRTYAELYGRLAGNKIHVGVSSAGQGGHGAYLGMTADRAAWLRERVPTSRLEILAHELAHSWWGWSVTSYGRGTKFLRESLANFSCWHLSERATGMKEFQQRLALLFGLGPRGHRALFAEDRDDQGLAYLKGPHVLNVLRAEMGEEVFLKALRHFATRHRDGHATFADFVTACNEASGQDWTPFFDQWCFGEGCPDYRLVGFQSEQQNGRWRTGVTIRNDGKGTVGCPLELRMAGDRQRETFRVPEGETSTFTYETPAEVRGVTIDPDHDTYQGGDEERKLKMLSVEETHSEWDRYWQGTFRAEIGEYDKAIANFSAAIDSHLRHFPRAHPAFYYSRGVTYLLMDDKASATADLSTFIDMVTENPQLVGTLAHAGVISGTQEGPAELHEILRALTGQDIELDAQAKAADAWEMAAGEWRAWWEAAKDGFQLAQSARCLQPTGLPRD